MNNALLFIGGLLVVTLAALFAVPHFVDWNGYRGVFEEEASKVLGRDVRVGGAVNVRFLPTPYVRFEKVRLADPTGQTGEPFVRADSFTMRLSGPALLRGVLEANEIELDKPELTLALDNAGSGNWATVQIKAGALPFIPQNVALHSVKIIDGAIAFYNAEAQQMARAEAIKGEFSAEALKGPFKFKGEALWAGEVRDVRFATTLPDAKGQFQLKAAMRGLTSGTSYALDTVVSELSGKPRFNGALTGKIPMQAVIQADGAKPAEPVVIDLQSRIDANTGGAKISDITLTVENVAEPQLITGSAVAVWGSAPRLDVTLASKWLDLDRLAGAGQDSATFLKIKQLGLSMLRGLAGSNGETTALVEIDQVKLGGETAGAMKIDAARRGLAVRLKELKAGLPGGSRLDVSGDLKDGDGKISFAGAGYIQGTNLARLLDWAAKSGANIDVKAEGPFSAEGQVQITDDRLELKEATAEIGGKSFSGDVVVSGDSRRRVAVTLEAVSIDTTQLFPETSRVLDASLRRALGIAPALTAGSDTAATGPATASESDMSVRVLAGELKHLDKTFRDVDATVRMDGGKIHIPSAKFTTPAGLAVGVEARISDTSQQPKGTLAYDLVASSSAAMKDMATLTGLAPLLPDANLARLTNAKLAGLVRLSNRHAGSADVTVDGTLQSARLTGSAEFDGGLQGWRSGQSRVRISSRSPALATLMSGLGVSQSAQLEQTTSEAELVFASSGKMAEAAAASMAIAAPGLAAHYDGGFTLADDGDVRIAGNLRIDAQNVADVLLVAGAPAASGIVGQKLSGTIATTREAGKWTLKSRSFTLGDSALHGTATLARNSDGALSINGDVSADTLTVAGLLAPLHDAAAAVASSDPATASPAPSAAAIWPAGTFNFAAFETATGTIKLDYRALDLHQGLVARDGKIEITLAPGKVAIGSLSGTAAGGALSGALQLSKVLGGINFDGSLKIDGAELAQLSGKGSGTATVEAKATAQAQSVAGLIAVLGGSGTITLADAVVPAPGPSIASRAITPMLAHKVRNQGDEVAIALQAAMPDARADLGTRTIPFSIADGVAKLDQQSLESPEGIVKSATVVDLTTFAIDSSWKLAAVVPPLPPPPDPIPGWVAPQPKAPLPAAVVVYTGNLGALSDVSVGVDASDMQRELAVRVLERNVEDLERVRKIDEYRAKVERDRRLAIEAERAAAAAAARAAAQKPPAAAAPPPSPQAQPELPPILPESSGATGDGQSSAPPPPTAASPPTAAPANGNVPPTDANAAQAADATEPEVVPSPQSAVRPQPPRPRPSQARRTTADEVMRSLGGYP